MSYYSSVLLFLFANINTENLADSRLTFLKYLSSKIYTKFFRVGYLMMRTKCLLLAQSCCCWWSELENYYLSGKLDVKILIYLVNFQNVPFYSLSKIVLWEEFNRTWLNRDFRKITQLVKIKFLPLTKSPYKNMHALAGVQHFYFPGELNNFHCVCNYFPIWRVHFSFFLCDAFNLFLFEYNNCNWNVCEMKRGVWREGSIFCECDFPKFSEKISVFFVA